MSILLVSKFKEEGIVCKFVEAEDPCCEDDSIEINKSLHVQIAFYSEKPFILNEWNESKGYIECLGEYGRDDLNSLVLKVKEILLTYRTDKEPDYTSKRGTKYYFKEMVYKFEDDCQSMCIKNGYLYSRDGGGFIGEIDQAYRSWKVEQILLGGEFIEECV